MVNALRRAAQVLRPGGHLVDIQPADTYLPRLALIAGGRRVVLGEIRRERDPSIHAAHRARRAVVAERLLADVGSTHGRWVSVYRSLGELRFLLRQNTNWRLDGALAHRLTAAWRRRSPGTLIEVRQTYSLAIFRAPASPAQHLRRPRRRYL